MLFQVVSTFYNGSVSEKLDPQSYLLVPEVMSLIVWALNTWNIETELARSIY